MLQIKRQELRLIRRIKQLKAPGRCSGRGSEAKRSNHFEYVYQLFLLYVLLYVLNLEPRSSVEFNSYGLT